MLSKLQPAVPQRFRTGRTRSRLISTQWNRSFKCRMHQSLKNTIDYIEVPSHDLAKTKKFFSALFGWSFVDYGPDYASFDDGRMAGGFFRAEKASGDPAIIKRGIIQPVIY